MGGSQDRGPGYIGRAGSVVRWVPRKCVVGRKEVVDRQVLKGGEQIVVPGDAQQTEVLVGGRRRGRRMLPSYGPR
jgi:hypothetical protein